MEPYLLTIYALLRKIFDLLNSENKNRRKILCVLCGKSSVSSVGNPLCPLWETPLCPLWKPSALLLRINPFFPAFCDFFPPKPHLSAFAFLPAFFPQRFFHR